MRKAGYNGGDLEGAGHGRRSSHGRNVLPEDIIDGRSWSQKDALDNGTLAGHGRIPSHRRKGAVRSTEEAIMEGRCQGIVHQSQVRVSSLPLE
jgi:hypothetical protein